MNASSSIPKLGRPPAYAHRYYAASMQKTPAATTLGIPEAPVVEADTPPCPTQKHHALLQDSMAARTALATIIQVLQHQEVNLGCPMTRCPTLGTPFPSPIELISHILECPEASKGDFRCWTCMQHHSWKRQHAPRALKSPVQLWKKMRNHGRNQSPERDSSSNSITASDKTWNDLYRDSSSSLGPPQDVALLHEADGFEWSEPQEMDVGVEPPHNWIQTPIHGALDPTNIKSAAEELDAWQTSTQNGTGLPKPQSSLDLSPTAASEHSTTLSIPSVIETYHAIVREVATGSCHDQAGSIVGLDFSPINLGTPWLPGSTGMMLSPESLKPSQAGQMPCWDVQKEHNNGGTIPDFPPPSVYIENPMLATPMHRSYTDNYTENSPAHSLMNSSFPTQGVTPSRQLHNNVTWPQSHWPGINPVRSASDSQVEFGLGPYAGTGQARIASTGPPAGPATIVQAEVQTQPSPQAISTKSTRQARNHKYRFRSERKVRNKMTTREAPIQGVTFPRKTLSGSDSKCPHCTYEPQSNNPKNRNTHLQRHMNIHQNVPKIKCDVPGCSSEISGGRTDNYREHLKKVHKMNLSAVSTTLAGRLGTEEDEDGFSELGEEWSRRAHGQKPDLAQVSRGNSRETLNLLMGIQMDKQHHELEAAGLLGSVDNADEYDDLDLTDGPAQRPQNLPPVSWNHVLDLDWD